MWKETDQDDGAHCDLRETHSGEPSRLPGTRALWQQVNAMVSHQGTPCIGSQQSTNHFYKATLLGKSLLKRLFLHQTRGVALF